MLCRCGHDKDWHAEGGTADCEHNAECPCEKFDPAPVAARKRGLADVVDFADRMHFGEAPAAKAEYEALLAIEAHVRAAFAGWQGRSKDLLDQLDKVRNG